ncbi:cell division protein FtsQ/DivIB [Patescibacteria group bacterium]
MSATVESKVWDLIDDKWIGFIPHSNIWLVSRTKLKSEIMSSLPGIEDIHIEKHLPNNLRLKLTVREPVFVWSSAGKYYYGDRTGMIFTEVMRTEITDVTLPFIHDTSNGTVTIQEHVLLADAINYLDDISLKLKDKFGFVITMYTAPSSLAPELEIHISEGWSIKLSPDDNQDQQIAILDKLLKEQIGSKRKSLLYVDLRTLELVTYKLK